MTIEAPTVAMPESLGKYRIDAVLGEGAMGVVYKAFDPAIERTVAIKTIRSAELTGSARAEYLARFRREAQAAGRLSHPNIVAVHSFVEDESGVYIVMEFVDGRSLGAALEQGERFELTAALRFTREVLKALDHAHAKGVIHRDVKPGNIMLTVDGRVKLTDFGIARLEDVSMTQTGSMLGTPSYMAPEQVQGRPVTAATDIYAAGIVLYELLTNDKPFSGSAATVMQKILNQPLVRPSLLNVGVPAWLDKVLEKAIAKAPSDRFQSAREFAEALRPPAVGKPAVPAAETGPNDGERGEWLPWVVGLGAFAAVIAASLMLLGPGATPSPELRAWQVAEGAGTPESYRAYLTAHADGVHSAEARQRIEVLENARHLAAAQADQRAWDESLERGTIEAFRRYVQSHPGGAFLAEANRRIIDLTDRESARTRTEREEVSAWAEAARLDTVEAYRGYRQAYPAGPNVAEAELRIARLEAAAREMQVWEEAVRLDSEPAYDAYRQAFPTGIHAEEARLRIESIRRAAIDRAEDELWNTVLALGTVEAYRRYLDEFPNGRFRARAEHLLTVAQAPEQANPVQPSSPPEAAPPQPAPREYMVWELEEFEKELSAEERRGVQEALLQLGHYAAIADGQFGPQTRTAIRQFQRHERADQTGLLSPEQMARLLDMDARLNRLTVAPPRAPVSGQPATAIRDSQRRYAHAYQLSNSGTAYGTDPEAVYWLILAAAEGHGLALGALGNLHFFGTGVERDPGAAELLWRAAAARGNAVAMYNLGRIYQTPGSAAPDLETARHWYTLAAELGDRAAADTLREIDSQ